jgi:hypothetical protein
MVLTLIRQIADLLDLVHQVYSSTSTAYNKIKREKLFFILTYEGVASIRTLIWCCE